MNASSVRRSVLLPLALSLFGCSRAGPTEPGRQEPVRSTPTVIAVTAPDSVPSGASFEVLVHRFWACDVDLPAASEWRGDSLIVSPVVIPQENCQPSPGWNPYAPTPCSQVPVIASGAPARTFDVVVNSRFGGRFSTRIAGGAPPLARDFVQRIEVRRADGTPVAGAIIVAATSGPPFDTLGTVVTGADGRAELVLAGSGPELRITEYVTTSGPGSDQTYQWFALERGRPIRTVILDRP